MGGADTAQTAPGFSEYAEAHGLNPIRFPTLPAQGGLLSQDDLKIEAAISGTLPGGEPGTLCHLTYTYRSNDSTHTVRRTAAVVAVAESIGFAPYMGNPAGALRGGIGMDTRAATPVDEH